MIPPGGAGIQIFFAAVLAVMAGLFGLFAWMGYAAWHIRFEVSPGTTRRC
jgi:hypothetical protein